MVVVAAIAWTIPHLGLTGDPSSSSGSNAPTSSGKKADPDKKKATESSSGASSTGNGSKEAFIRDYYAEAPGGSEKAWAMLAPQMQTMGRDRYLGFWRTIESVDVQDVQVTGDSTVEVTLVYRTTGGRTSTERKREQLSRTDDGDYQIVSDTPAG